MDQVKISEFKNLLWDDIENWKRWGGARDYLPQNGGSTPIGELVEIGVRGEQSSVLHPQIDELRAIKMENVVVGLPQPQKTAFLLYTTGRAPVREKIRYVGRRIDGARIMRVGLSMYHRRVREAFAAVLASWDQNSA